MSMFDLKGGTGSGWNYADSTKENYSPTLEGTVVEISNPQKVDFNTRQPEFWPDGNPKRVIRIMVKTRDGNEFGWTFNPKSAAANACLVALDPQDNRPQVSLKELLGKFVSIQTQDGVYNAQHPRPWWVKIAGEGDAAAVRGLKDLSQQPQQAPAPAPQPQPQPAPSQFQMAQQAAQQAVAAQSFRQAPQPVNQVPADAYGMYDSDIPF